MEHLPKNNTAQSGDPVVKPVATEPVLSLGGMLREARERLGLSVAEVAGQIKFAPRQIEALEADDFGRLAEGAFLRGFVRSYAKILHLDAHALLAALPQPKLPVSELLPSSVEVPFPSAHLAQHQNLILLGAALVLAVVVVMFSVWHYTAPLKQTSQTPLAETSPGQSNVEQLNGELIQTPIPLPAAAQLVSEIPVLKPADTAPEVALPVTVEPKVKVVPKAKSAGSAAHSSVRAAKTLTVQPEPQAQPNNAGEQPDAPAHITPAHITKLRLEFEEESWAEIKDKDGKVISSQVNPKGSVLYLEGAAPLSLILGHASTVSLSQDGVQVDLTRYINSSSAVARLTLK